MSRYRPSPDAPTPEGWPHDIWQPTAMCRRHGTVLVDGVKRHEGLPCADCRHEAAMEAAGNGPLVAQDGYCQTEDGLEFELTRIRWAERQASDEGWLCSDGEGWAWKRYGDEGAAPSGKDW